MGISENAMCVRARKGGTYKYSIDYEQQIWLYQIYSQIYDKKHTRDMHDVQNGRPEGRLIRLNVIVYALIIIQ